MTTPAAADSAVGGLAITYGPERQTYLGPGLQAGMGDVEVFDRLNTWGAARDNELVDLRSSLASTQTIVDATFVEARGMLLTIVHEFRREAEVSRNHGAYEAAQSLACLERVVAEARARFDAQDARVSQDLGELARRVAAAPAPPGVQPQAMTFQAAPAPQLVTSPGGTVRFYPGGPVAGLVLEPQRQQQGAAAANPCAQPQRFEMNTPNYAGGGGGSAYPKEPREMRLDARGWTSQKLDVGVAVDVFQIWN